MIDNYFELTLQLTVSYLRSHFAKRVGTDLEKTSATDSSVHYLLVHLGKAELYVVLNKLSDTVTVVSLVAVDKLNELVVVDWDKIQQVSFPVNEISVLEDLIRQFNKEFEKHIKNMDDLKAVFDVTTEQRDGSESDKGSDDKRHTNSVVRENVNVAPQIAQPPVVSPSNPSRPSDMPDFEDELEIRARPRQSQQVFPLIGDGDLNPPGLPKNPELKLFIDPLGGSSNGMYPSADHPMFGNRESGNTSRLGVPPGARFDDPYGEDNLEAMGSGLPGTLRGGAMRGPGFDPMSGRPDMDKPDFDQNKFAGPGFGGPGFGGKGLGGFPF